ncbi:hypothetical protein [Rhizobium leguminosarum]|uniref:hypothetical protein n=1 Tax=Rhizobium leguminosarum TaxID=384 RepID=UPI001031F8EF|nr:hypothetical protein [Rhizobium leguminosarum]TAY14024.1 hypothetical protein ELH96_20725 [Rhizobium leguminosarum]
MLNMIWRAGCMVLILGLFAAWPIRVAGEEDPGETLQGKFSDAACTAAFHALPKGASPFDPSVAEALLNYDTSCFKNWNGLRENSRLHLATTVGTLFGPDGNPFCTATRIKSNVIMTAAHCKMNRTVFRLFGYPDTPLKVKSQILKGSETILDLSDYALWEIEDNKLPFDGLPIRRDFSPHQAITIVAVSQVPFYLTLNADASHWLDAVRWSPTRSAQIWPPSEVVPPIPRGSRAAECIFHKMPTFPGMSGAPIIGVLKPRETGGKPELFVAGIHLRDGTASVRAAGCGVRGEYNVGIRVPAPILEFSK